MGDRRAPRVTHFGNFGTEPGGISSVLREYASWSWPRVSVDFVDTYATAPTLWGARRWVAASRALVTNRRAIDIAHVHLSERGSFLREGSLVAIASALSIPVVATLHGADFIEFAKAHPGLARAVLSRCSEVVALSPEIAAHAREMGAARTTLVPNGCLASTRSNAPERAGVVFAGEFSRRKGADVLLEAWRLAAPREHHLEVFGPVPDEASDWPVPAGVNFRGTRARAEVRASMEEASLVVLPSRAEAFPMALVEAMASGTAVLASEIAGIPWMLDDSAQLVPPDDAEALARSISALLNDPARARAIGARNRQRHQELMSPDAIASALESVYFRASQSDREHGPEPEPIR